MSDPVLLGIDQGTTGTRIIACGRDLKPIADVYRKAEPSHPHPGWIEKDANAVVASVEAALEEIVERVGGRGRIAAVGLDNEGESTVAWDADTLQPLAPAIVWGCRRTQGIVDRLAASGVGPRVQMLSGLPLDPYFSATKMRWLLDEEPAVLAAAEAGRLRFGTLDAYVCARLGDGARTDPSTAHRTQLQALRRPGSWDPELLAIHDVDEAWLPPIGSSSGDLGSLCGLPLRAMLVDQTAAMIGDGCVRPGDVKATYGTGIFVLQQAGPEPPIQTRGLLPTVAWQLGEEFAYALDGGVFSAGTVIEWLRFGAGLISTVEECEELARSVPDSDGVRFLPALAGLGAPWWRPEARGVWSGITSGTARAHLVRAALDALCLRVRDVIEVMSEVAGRPEVLRIDGGMTGNGWLVQRQADVLGIPVEISDTAEATALGAAAFAAVGAGLLTLDEAAATVAGGRRVDPVEPIDALEYGEWRAFVEIASKLR